MSLINSITVSINQKLTKNDFRIFFIFVICLYFKAEHKFPCRLGCHSFTKFQTFSIFFCVNLLGPAKTKLSLFPLFWSLAGQELSRKLINTLSASLMKSRSLLTKHSFVLIWQRQANCKHRVDSAVFCYRLYKIQTRFKIF